MPLNDTNSSNDNDEVIVEDTCNNGGLDDVLTVGTSATEVKVGGSAMSLRKMVILQALDTGFSYGFSNITQSFPLYKNQTVMIPAGEDTAIWVVNTASSKSIAVAEL